MTKLMDELVEAAAEIAYDHGAEAKHLKWAGMVTPSAEASDVDREMYQEIVEHERGAMRAAVHAVLAAVANKMLETPPDGLDGSVEWENYVAKLMVDELGYSSAPGRDLR